MNVGDQINQQTGQNSINQSIAASVIKKQKVNYWVVKTVLLILLIVVVAISAFLLGKNYNVSPFVKERKIADFQQSSPSITVAKNAVTSIPAIKKSEEGEFYKNRYGEYQVKVPDQWKATGCMGAGIINGCSALSPKNISSYEIIIVNTVLATDKNKTYVNRSLNFNIPSIGAGMNASLQKDTNQIQISFIYRGVYFTVTGNYQDSAGAGYPVEKLDEIVKSVAKSITFLNEPAECEIALMPLTDFPDNFVLYNYHDSDSNDPVYSYWPYTNKKDNGEYLQTEARRDSKRGFMVHYVKDGKPVNNDIFNESVIPIYPTSNGNRNFDDRGTGIWHINCVDTQKDGPGNESPLHIGTDENDPFAILLYGYASNSEKLWGVNKWNISLLKSTRNKVYIRRNSLWQAYRATDYYATMPTAYGGKPAIYLYPSQKQTIKVEIHPRGLLTKTDTTYNPDISGWKVVADKNGLINNNLKYLYYEAMLPVDMPKFGYVVPYNNLFRFSREYVIELGLTEAEADEFVAFWKTRLPESPYYFVSHLDQETIAKIYPLVITPSPNTLIRIELYFKPLLEKINIAQPRKPIYPVRNGFTAVEWGGILDQN